MSDALIETRGRCDALMSAKVAPLNRLASSQRGNCVESLMPPEKPRDRLVMLTSVESDSSALRSRNRSRKSASAARFFKPK